MIAEGVGGNRERLALRRDMRARRRSLGDRESQVAARAIVRRLNGLGAYRRALRVGVYIAVNGEPDLESVTTSTSGRGKRFFAPALVGDHLRFVRLSQDSTLRENRFGIPEPDDASVVDPRHLDVVLAPLVAFDDRGVRLGMGGGHYDRCFKFLRRRVHWRKPKLIGVGYEFQRVPRIERCDWDIPLWAAVTEQTVQFF